ncbi:uncharacterized protein LOC100825293 [Brachypodium distachyon]|uniref:DUF1995 domain-containing protein n=1 Tax=Brachypodium distachyon TaxID=15368 RepID=I1HHY7_BRADI|nr:uncharacterized protein LOC100825293 [Brachypodium distachyon]KQK05554.1 hypothetical protein BRADI_2g20790v3 [Brachypodium distachyon]|eukprot:XP_003568168.1 uncharacterized protein LOC100825293 [Brachypodium distachyon]
MASSLLNPPPSKLALNAPVPPLRKPPSLFSPPHRSPLHLALLVRSPPPRRVVQSSSSPSTDGGVPSPPSSRDEAVAQARSCLATALRKPLSNSLPARNKKPKNKQQRQARFRAEIPVVDESSPGSLARLAFDVFSGLGVSTKGGSPARLLLVWPSSEDLSEALREFEKWGDTTLAHADLDSVSSSTDAAASDAAVFLAPARSQAEKLRAAASALDPKPVVLFNPAWGFEDEEEWFGGAVAKGFVASFDVVYSFTGLEVRGLLSKKKGVLLRRVDGGSGRSGGESWVLMVEDEEAPSGFKVVSRLKRRPTIGEVENMMYNLMAANSPVTKSARFLRELVSNVTGKKQ